MLEQPTLIKLVTRSELFTRYKKFCLLVILAKKINFQIKVDYDSKPMFYRSRSVPFRYRFLVQEELAHLESAGTTESLDHSEWARPVMAVLKHSDKRRQCGN